MGYRDAPHRLVPVSLAIGEPNTGPTRWRCLACDEEWYGLPDTEGPCDAALLCACGVVIVPPATECITCARVRDALA